MQVCVRVGINFRQEDTSDEGIRSMIQAAQRSYVAAAFASAV